MVIFCKENKYIPDEPAEHTIENEKQIQADHYQFTSNFHTMFKAVAQKDIQLQSGCLTEIRFS